MPKPTYLERVHLRQVLMAELVDVSRACDAALERLVDEATLDSRNHADGPDMSERIREVAALRERLMYLTTSVECVSLACLSLS